MARVAIIDDDALATGARKAVLEAMGYQVDVYSTGVDALTAFRTTAPDIVCLDVVLPGLCGRDVFEKLRALPGCQGVPVIVLSAIGFVEDLPWIKAAENVLPLNKPCLMEELNDAIEKMLHAIGGVKA